MKILFFSLACCALFFASCRSVPVAPTAAQVPTNLPSALERGRSELAAGNWGTAWSLVANQAGSNDDKTRFLQKVQEAMDKERVKAMSTGLTRRALDLEASLALIEKGNWTPAPLNSPAVSSSTPADWLKGTATVVVNRGLRVENGSAQPDIVIGSGFFISNDGYLLTNHHVIESEVEPGPSVSSRLSIRLPGSKGERLPAKVVGWDRNLDLALLKTEYKPDYVFSLSTGLDPIPGQRLQALGSPAGLRPP